MELASWLRQGNWTPAQRTSHAQDIYDRVLAGSAVMRRGNFESIGTRDLERLWRLYDEITFECRLSRALGDRPLTFRLSRRLTSAAGQTTRRVHRRSGVESRCEYEISISTTLLFQTFVEDHRIITVSGVPCHDRLQALQRVFEHELTHLAEMIAWSDSHCAARRFQSIAGRLFGHREHTHQLITPRERAWNQLGLKVGDRVRFRCDGREYVGRLNRITRRATVLVEDHQGPRYSDGKHYAKFYVPLQLLMKQ
ncbi:MAG: hypothetical protein AB7F89_27375 [Pirellulaceae bacterium]